jgi:hypothetical protein
MMAGISLLSGSPGVQTGGWGFPGIDKLAHFVVFGLLGIAWARSFSAASFSPLQRLLLAGLLGSLFGLADEAHQLLNPGRTFEWGDWLADTAGAFVLAAFYLYWRQGQMLCELEFRDLRRLRPGRGSPDSIS